MFPTYVVVKYPFFEKKNEPLWSTEGVLPFCAFLFASSNGRSLLNLGMRLPIRNQILHVRQFARGRTTKKKLARQAMQDESSEAGAGEGEYAEQEYAEGGEGEYEYGEYDETYAYSTVRAIYDFTGDADDQLTFVAGTEFTLLEELEGGWWRGELEGKQGLFPADYVDYVTNDGEGEQVEGTHEGDGGGVEEEEDASKSVAEEKRERRRKAEEDLETMERQIEEEKMAKGELERELAQLRLVKSHTKQALDEMAVVRSDTQILALDLMKLLFELDEETESMAELEAARQTLQAELNNFNDYLSKEVKKGSLIEQFKPDILRKLTQLKLKLADDDMFTGIYEKKKNEFSITLKQLTDKTKGL